MALNDVTDLVTGVAATNTAEIVAIEALASVVAANSPPTLATVGADLDILKRYVGRLPEEATARVRSTAGSGTMDVTIRVWGYQGALGWAPLGYLNGGSAIAETSANSIQYAEPLALPAHFTRIFFEVTAINGTSTAVTVYLVARRHYGGN